MASRVRKRRVSSIALVYGRDRGRGPSGKINTSAPVRKEGPQSENSRHQKSEVDPKVSFGFSFKGKEVLES